MKLTNAACCVLIFVLPLFVLAASGKHSKSQNSPQQTESTPQANSDSSKGEHFTDNPADPSLYAGTDTCKTCHEDIGKTYDHSPHWKTMLNHRGVQYQG